MAVTSRPLSRRARSPSKPRTLTRSALRASMFDFWSVRTLPEGGKAIRLTVQTTDEDLTRTLLERYGAEYKVLRKVERTVFVVANPDGLSREEHPYALQLLREGRKISYVGVIGPVTFDQNGDITGPFRKWRITDGNIVTVAVRFDRQTVVADITSCGRR